MTLYQKISRFFGSRSRAEAAQCKLALIGANKGLRRQQAKLSRLEAFLENHQLWIDYREKVKENDERMRAAKKTAWARTHPNG